MEITFNSNGNEKQKLAYKLWSDKKTNDIVYGGSKGSGKSYLGASIIFGTAFMYPDTMWFIARKELTDLRKHTTPTIMEALNNMGISAKKVNFNSNDNIFYLDNGSQVLYLAVAYRPSDHLYMRFGSHQYTGGWIEEAGEFTESAKNNLYIACGRWNNKKYDLPIKMLQTCNPSKNYLYHSYYIPHKDGNLSAEKAFIKALPNDNKMLPPHYVENLERTLSNNEKERLLYGNWEYDDDDLALIPYDNIKDCMIGYYNLLGKDRYISADIARKGSDSTVIGVWEGLTCFKIVQLKKSLIDETTNVILKLMNDYKVDKNHVVVDTDGVGAGVRDNIRCKEFVNNSRPIKARNRDNFVNIKSQCYFYMADMINSGLLKIYTFDSEKKRHIIQELEQVKAKTDSDEKKKSIVSKEIVREKLGRSPDYTDMVAMRMKFEIKPSLEQIVF